jgi:hypothetical protein
METEVSGAKSREQDMEEHTLTNVEFIHSSRRGEGRP